MNLGFDLKIEQTQKLNLTQEMVQAIKILQLNGVELEQFVNKQLLENPVLERDLLVVDSKNSLSGLVKDKPQGTPFKKFNLNKETLGEHLLHQLQFVSEPKCVISVCELIVDALDDNGYLRVTADVLAEEADCEQHLIEKALDIVHGLEPAGVGARNLNECLVLQLRAANRSSEIKEQIITDYLEEIALNRLQQIARKVGTTIENVQAIADEIKSLDPKPGRAFASAEETRYITPDVYLEIVDGQIKLTMSEGSKPTVSINKYYMDMLENSKDNPELSEYLVGRIKEAKWLIDSIEQRRNTIFNVARAIVDYQDEFFAKGDRYMKPLVLRQIAETVGVHESTVSRTINGKYIQSPMGVFELKYFFNRGVSGQDGEDVSSKVIKLMIKELVDGEDPKKPISDQKIVEALANKGVDVARRTVAKYREEMGIFSSQKRKRY